MDSEWDDSEEEHYIACQFELLNSEDERTITLVCSADEPMDPLSFADALKKYAKQIEIWSSFADDDTPKLMN